MTAVFQEPTCCWNRSLHRICLCLFSFIIEYPSVSVGLKKLGRLFTAYAIYTLAVYSLFAWLITDVFPIDVSIASPLAGTDLLLCALFGGVISGIGSGLAIRFGGAMDGIEVMAVIFSKRLGITVGTFVMIYNMMPGSKGQKAIHACMIRLLNLGPAKHEVQNIQWMFVLHRPKRSVDSSDLRSKSADFECL
ncbi:MAG: YitT family protein [Lachnospiraceae bacterium]